MTSLLLLRGEDPPDDTVVVIRGGEHGLDDEVVHRTAERSFEEYGFYGVSVFLAVDRPVDRLCAELDQLRRYGRVRLSTAGDLRRAGFTLLSTGRSPHFDVALPDLAAKTLGRLREVFGPPVPNPGRPG